MPWLRPHYSSVSSPLDDSNGVRSRLTFTPVMVGYMKYLLPSLLAFVIVLSHASTHGYVMLLYKGY
jgi:hypothetical protein